MIRLCEVDGLMVEKKNILPGKDCQCGAQGSNECGCGGVG